MNLVLNTFWTALNRDNEGFVVTQQQMRQRIPTEDLRKAFQKELIILPY